MLPALTRHNPQRWLTRTAREGIHPVAHLQPPPLHPLADLREVNGVVLLPVQRRQIRRHLVRRAGRRGRRVPRHKRVSQQRLGTRPLLLKPARECDAGG